MSKQSKNATRADKQVGKNVVQAVKPAKVPKLAGPVPKSYAPKQARSPEQGRQPEVTVLHDAPKTDRQKLVVFIEENYPFLPDCVVGLPGQYLIGGVVDGNLVACGFNVLLLSPVKNGQTELLVIREVRATAATKNPVHLNHSWLFQKNHLKVPFAKGLIGEIQRDMLCYLQEGLADQIAALKQHRAEVHQPPLETEVPAQLGTGSTPEAAANDPSSSEVVVQELAEA